MDQFLSRLAEQWAVIKAAPLPFILAIGISASAIWWLVNFVYSGVVSAKNAQLELADRQLKDYQQKLSGATPDEAAKKIADLEKRVTALGPRLLSQDQKSKMIPVLQRLAEPETVNISVDMLCNDCPAFAEDLASTFSSVPKWTIVPNGFAGSYNIPARGLILQVADPKAPPLSASLAAEALNAASISFQWVQGEPSRSLTPTARFSILVRPPG